MSRVWKHSEQRGGALLILLALADFADDDGYAWPAVPTLAAKARMTERNARYTLRSLEAAGEITTTPGGGRYGTSGYVVKTGAEIAGGQNLPGAKRSTKGAKRDTLGGKPIAPNPSLGTVIEPSLPVATDAPGELDQSTPPKHDAWLPLKEAIATVATGKPKVTGAKGQPVKWIGSLVGDVGRIAGDDVETALAIWAAFEGALTPDDREKYINSGNVGQRFTKWSMNGGAGAIRGVLARREREASGEPRPLPDWMAGA